MAKIKSGVLGGMSGTIGEVTGYRRDGNNIITSKPNQPNQEINSYMNSKNELYKYCKNLPGTLTAIQRNGYFLLYNYFGTFSERLADFFSDFPPMDYRGRLQKTIIGSSYPFTQAGMKKVYFPGTKQCGIIARPFGVGTTLPGLLNCCVMFWNLTKNTRYISIRNYLNGNINENSSGNFAFTGDIIICTIGINRNLAGVSYETWALTPFMYQI